MPTHTPNFFYTHHHHSGTVCSCPTFCAYCAPNPFRVCAEFCKLLGLEKMHTLKKSRMYTLYFIKIWKTLMKNRETGEIKNKIEKEILTNPTATAIAITITNYLTIYMCMFFNMECDIDLFSRSIQPSSNALGKNVTLFTTLSMKLRLTFVKFILGKFIICYIYLCYLLYK